MKLEIAGENSVIVYFGEQATASVSAQVQQAANIVTRELENEVIDVIASYASLLIIYDIDKTDFFSVKLKIKNLLSNLEESSNSSGKVVELPVYYSTESGADLERIANAKGINIDDVIDIHQQGSYRVYAIGFAPGFAYLGEVDDKIAMPRLSKPRLKVPKGAVAIADRQTAVYPAQSPGGWNLVGLCPIEMFNATNQPHMPVEVGDTIKFKSITKQEFIDLGGDESLLLENSHD